MSFESVFQRGIGAGLWPKYHMKGASMRRALKVIVALAMLAISVFAVSSVAGAQVPDFEASAEAVAGCPSTNTTVELTVKNNSTFDVWVYVYLDPATDYEAVQQLDAGTSAVINTGAMMAPAGTMVVEFSETPQGEPLETLRADWDCSDTEEPETTTGPLHNDTANEGSDCPDQVNDYWHFVLTPNNGSSVFVSITLNLDGDVVEFTGDDIIPNGTQYDNVFVAVPVGYALTDLVKEGSEAEWTGPATQFVLSHVCDGGTTTSSSSTSTTSTTSTTVSSNSTPTTGAQQPTQVGGVTIPRAQDPATLPRTGSNLTLAFFAMAFLAAGALALGAKHKLLKQ